MEIKKLSLNKETVCGLETEKVEMPKAGDSPRPAITLACTHWSACPTC